MNYTEWCNELNNNLLSVSKNERRKVLDYYAEAYADRREAGFSEQETINDFGAPNDAARRILTEKDDEVISLRQESANNVSLRSASIWVFAFFCIIFWMPLLGLILAMVGITIGFCCVPICVIGIGTVLIGDSIGTMMGGDLYYGLYILGSGIITFGVGIVLCSIFFKLVGLMWKLLKKGFCWLKSLFRRKEV